MRYCQFSSFNHIYIDEYRETKPSLLCSIRVLVAFLSMLGTSIMYITRVNLNIAILAMVQQPTQPLIGTTSLPLLVVKPLPLNVSSTPEEILLNTAATLPIPNQPPPPIVLIPETEEFQPIGEFDWTPPQQGIILGSFFYGYLATQIIGGRLAESYLSPDRLIFLALASSGLINLLTPFLARRSLPLFICSRILLGSFQGVLYPAFYCLFSRWIPSNERSTFIPWLDAGCIMGTILISASSGKIIVWFASFGGWPFVFYFSGSLALLWSILWICFVRSNPEDHPLITKEELILLSRNQNHQQQQQQKPLDGQKAKNGQIMETTTATSTGKVQPIWFNILTSPIFYGVVLTKIGYGIVFDFVSQKVPAYLQDVIGLAVDETGISFSFIMIGYMGTLLSCGAFADTLIKHTSISTGIVRKLFQFISGCIMIICLILIPEVGLSKWANIFLLAGVMLGYGFTSGGDIPAVVDISGPVSGTVFALMNTLCSISGFMVPYLVGIAIQAAPSSLSQWRYLFISGAVIIGIGMLSFLIFARTRLQLDWFRSTPSSSTDDTNTKSYWTEDPMKIPMETFFPQEYYNPYQIRKCHSTFDLNSKSNEFYGIDSPNNPNYIPKSRYHTFPIGSV